MANGRECSKCGAAAAVEASSYCAYCGAELPLPESGLEQATEARFAVLRVHPHTDRAMKSAPADRSDPGRPATGAEWRWLALVLVAAALPLLLVRLSWTHFGEIRLLAVSMVVVGGILVLVAIAVALRRLPAVATPGYRGPVPGEGDDASRHLIRVLSTSEDVTRWGDIVITKHLALLEWRGGERHTVEVESKTLSRTLVHNDMGVATIRGGRLVGFVRVEV